MFKGGRYFYAVFMCHLAIEKRLKGLFAAKMNAIPPKSHSLIYFVNKLDLIPPEPIARFLVQLNQASVTTRYPESLTNLEKTFTKAVVRKIMQNTERTIEWINQQF